MTYIRERDFGRDCPPRLVPHIKVRRERGAHYVRGRARWTTAIEDLQFASVSPQTHDRLIRRSSRRAGKRYPRPDGERSQSSIPRRHRPSKPESAWQGILLPATSRISTQLHFGTLARSEADSKTVRRWGKGNQLKKAVEVAKSS